MWPLLNENRIQPDALHGEFDPQEAAVINCSCWKGSGRRERHGELRHWLAAAETSSQLGSDWMCLGWQGMRPSVRYPRVYLFLIKYVLAALQMMRSVAARCQSRSSILEDLLILCVSNSSFY